ncbi:hypothetical protein ACFE04_021839 [Oxalis oulophora]
MLKNAIVDVHQSQNAQLEADAVVSPPIGRGQPTKNPNVKQASKKLKTIVEGGSGSGRPCDRPRKFPLSSDMKRLLLLSSKFPLPTGLESQNRCEVGLNQEDML